jgi:hypothetical protein
MSFLDLHSYVFTIFDIFRILEKYRYIDINADWYRSVVCEMCITTLFSFVTKLKVMSNQIFQ